ncbi:FAD-binding oxidoreductase [Acidianus sp. HS-5]|uniref:NAD(P)/FAD-dependent oxidoreductase n=1 Tax=Acidianus sp. HS-5 TaxID=2886040 RepID=UPI001F323285|nr:FAD-binding oxidoreductase [Acidianus sp. HS-5]BDC18188.1 FAD-dependent oxidoreductase [Acidianus sp. HS-5]
MKVAIIGGGIVGLFTAYFLKKEDVDVTVFEKADLGSYSIHAAGLIEPYRFDKINSVSMILKMLKYSMRGTTYIRNVNKLWLKELIYNLNKNPPEEAWETMKEMAEFSLKTYKTMAEERNDFDYKDDGLYEVYLRGEDLEKGLEDEKKSPFNPRFEKVDFEGFAGAIFFPELSRISTEKFIDRMRSELQGVKMVNKEVQNMTELKDFDEIVLATGVWTTRFITSLPVTAFKGYGYRVKGTPKYNKPMVLVDDGIAISPFDDFIKITGGFDADNSYDSSRAQLVLEKTSKIIDISYIYEMNMGFRPCSPDGFPIIGKRGNVTITTGACRLGWSYAPAMGKYTTDLVLGKLKDLGYISRYVKF